MDGDLTSADTDSNQLTPRKLSNSVTLIPLPLTEGVGLGTDYTLLDPNVQKTGNIITLKYNSVDWISQELATRVENVNPFHVIDYNGQINLIHHLGVGLEQFICPKELIEELIEELLGI